MNVQCPNAWKEDDIGFAEYYVEIKDLPSNISYIRVYTELVCETTGINTKLMSRWWMNGNGWGLSICKRADYQNVNYIDTYCKVDILCIKYKTNDESDKNKNDYILETKMNEYDEYEWIINDKKQMQKMKSMYSGMALMSDTFGYDDNWTVHILPSGFRRNAKYPGKVCIQICCIKLPHGITAMDIKYSIKLQCKSRKMSQFHEDTNVCFHHHQQRRIVEGNRMCMECPNIDIDKLCDEEWVKINVTIKIINIYDDESIVVWSMPNNTENMIFGRMAIDRTSWGQYLNPR